MPELKQISNIVINGENYLISDETVQTILQIIYNNNGAISSRINDLNERITNNYSYIQNINSYWSTYTNVQSDWNETNTSSYAYINNKPSIPDDSNLVHKTDNETITGIKTFNNDIIIRNINSLWNSGDCTNINITKKQNKPYISLTGNIVDETIPASEDFSWIIYFGIGSSASKAPDADTVFVSKTLQQALDERNNVQANWNEGSTTSSAYIMNKPSIPNDSNLVHKTGNESISGTKTFGSNRDNIKLSNSIEHHVPELITGNTLKFNWISIHADLTEDDLTLQQALDERNNVKSDWNETNTSSYAYINNKPTIPTVPTTSTTVTENDTNPVSGGAVYSKFEDLIGTAPAALDTLGEIATALNNDADLAGTLTTQISQKIPKVTSPTTNNFASFNSDGTIKDSGVSASNFITTETQPDWNETNTSSYAYILNKPTFKTVNNESLIGTGNIVVSGLPQVSASDNGKILMVVNGQWQLVSPSVLYSGNGIPNNNYGNNGDLFIQTD